MEQVFTSKQYRTHVSIVLAVFADSELINVNPCSMGTIKSGGYGLGC